MKRYKRYIFIILLVFFIAVFLVSGFLLAHYMMESRKQKLEFDKLAEMVDSVRNESYPTIPAPSQAPEPTPDPTEETEPVSPYVTVTDPETGEEMQILPEFAELYLMNNDLVGWIQVPGTNINYPVMQTPDHPDFYLRTSYQKEYSRHGCIYVREQCDVNAPSDNLTIYGHCMSDGTMFAELSGYTDEAFWEEHRTFTFDTLTEYHTYEIIAVFKTSANLGKGFAYHHFVDAANEAEFDEFVSTCKDLAFYDTGITAEYGDKLICLSTCEYTLNNGRLVVVGKQIS